MGRGWDEMTYLPVVLSLNLPFCFRLGIMGHRDNSPLIGSESYVIILAGESIILGWSVYISSAHFVWLYSFPPCQWNQNIVHWSS